MGKNCEKNSLFLSFSSEKIFFFQIALNKNQGEQKSKSISPKNPKQK
jgi:hypothetical protein